MLSITLDGHDLSVSRSQWAGEGPDSVSARTVRRRDTDGELRDANERFRTAFHGAPIGLALVAPDGEFLHVNDALCRIVGYPREVLTTKTFQEITHPEDLDIDVALTRQVLEGHIPSYSLEKRYFHADGHIVWVNLSVSIVQGGHGTRPYFISHIEDVTERKQVEEALRRETATVGLLKCVAAAANGASHPHEAFATALDAVCAHAGWPVGHVYFRADDFNELRPSTIWHLEDSSQLARLKRAVRPLHRSQGLPGRVLDSGLPTWVSDVAGTFSRDAAATELGFEGGCAFPVLVGSEIVAVLAFFSTDTTEPDAALLEVMANVGTQLGRVVERARLEEQQEKLDATRSRFVANAAHELRTPLTSLRTIAALLGSRRDDMTADEIAECCDLLERQGRNLDALVGDLLDLTRIEHGERTQHIEPIAVDDWVAGALETAPPPDGVNVTLELEPGLTVAGNPARLNRVLVNLLTNAYRHGGPSVLLSSRIIGAHTVLAVEDDGGGVPADLVAHLFEPFTRSNSVQEQGNGLGLAIADAIVERLGGRLRYELPGAGGARFTVRLPVAP